MELMRTPHAGGQVKCWERLAEAAAELEPDELGVDLTVYVLGPRPGLHPLSPAVRFVALRPVVSTAPLTRHGGVDASDLAPWRPLLARRLRQQHDVWHLTHLFAFAGTAVRLRRSSRAGLVASVHTDVPELATAFLGGRSAAAGRLAGTVLRRRRDRLLRACDHTLVAEPEQRAELASVVGAHRVSLLGRGVDRGRFHADASARAAFLRRHDVPPGRTLVLFAGRADASKRVLLLTEAVRRLLARGRRVQLLVAGDGPDASRVADRLGTAATLLGVLPQEELALAYAASDVLAFPSRSETVGNVVGEALACGLPVVLPAGARTVRWLAAPGADGVVVEDDTAGGWAAALGRLVDDPALRAAIAERAAATGRERLRTWTEVLTEDLLPVWRAVTPPVLLPPVAPSPRP
ncbi:glycosyltransferase [Streptomyces sp. JJ36]|nr:glycosyltransferase [Streptomyces sp. JJ36]